MVAITPAPSQRRTSGKLDDERLGNVEEPAEWKVEDHLQEAQRVCVTIEGREVHLRAWKYEAKGVSGCIVPVFFLDTQLPRNSEWDRTLTDTTLYGGDEHYRPVPGNRSWDWRRAHAARCWAANNLKRFHMNEGHAGLLTLELLDDSMRAAKRDA